MSNSNTEALTLHKRNVGSLNRFITGRKPKLAELIPAGGNLDQIVRVAIFEAIENEKLAACAQTEAGQMSFYKSVARACELGLVASGSLSRAHLIPRWNKDGGYYYCTLMIGYTGLMDLARRSGVVKSIKAIIVYENDEWSYRVVKTPEGQPAEVFEHVPAKGDRGGMALVYAWASLANGDYQMEILSKEDVEKAREYAQGAGRNDSPWNKHPKDMWRKTAIRKLCKFLPLDPEAQAAISEDVYNEYGDVSTLPTDVADVIDVDAEPAPEAGEPSPAARAAVQNATQNAAPAQEPPPRQEQRQQQQPSPEPAGWDDDLEDLPPAHGYRQ